MYVCTYVGNVVACMWVRVCKCVCIYMHVGG